MNHLLEQLSEDLADVNARVMQSLVQVRLDGRNIGAGTVWRSDGLIVTNAHVVEGNERMGAELSVRVHDGRDLPARVIAIDRHHDLAALVVNAGNLVAIQRSDASAAHPGQIALAFGFPWGVVGGTTIGSIIAVVVREKHNRRSEWLAANLHLRPGHSGGPMVDASGRLLGINTMINGPDVGVAVPIQKVEEFLQRTAALAAASAESGIALL